MNYVGVGAGKYRVRADYTAVIAKMRKDETLEETGGAAEAED